MAHFQFRPFRPLLAPAVIVAGIAALSGCTSTVRKQSVLGYQDSRPGSEPLPVAVDIPEPVEAEPVEPACGAIVQQAREYCNRSEFSAADSLCRMIFSGLSEAGGGDSGDASDVCLDEIIAVYAELMPDTFPVPEEIAPQVFHLQLLGSLDSLQFTPDDSALVAGVFNRSRKAMYDVPVVWNDRVQRALLYYLTRNKSTVRRWRERAVAYLPFMKKMFADSGLPQDLAYLPLIESGFNPKAYSRSHASGIWQFIRSTGRKYGLRSNYWIDERRDPVRATQAAIRYLKKLYGDFGHWHLALAAYNCGEGGLSRNIEKSGTDDYWQLKLPDETMNYVPLYLASLAIAKSPDFAEVFTGLSDTLPFDTVTLKDCLDLRDIARGTGVDYDSLRALNPQLLHWCTPPDMTGIPLNLPAGTASAFKDFYNGLPDDKKVKWYRYRIRPGDNLGSIARRFRLPIEGIKSVNRMHGTRIIAGKYLFIPVPVGDPAYVLPKESDEKTPVSRMVMQAEVPEGATLTVYEVKPGDTVWRLSELFGVSQQQICGWNNLEEGRIRVGQILSIYTTAGPPADSGDEPVAERASVKTEFTGMYVVSQGDNAFRIAQRHGMTLQELYAVNGINPDLPVVRPGDTLHVKKIPLTTAAVSRTEPVNRSTRPATGESMVMYIVAAGDNLFRIARNFSVPVERIRHANNLGPNGTIRAGDTLAVPAENGASVPEPSRQRGEVVYYKVRNGDNLWRIASSFGISVERLYRFNGLEENAVIMPGDTLRVVKNGEM